MTIKLKGSLRLISGKKIRSPLNNKTRPTSSLVREALINILDKKLNNASWLDLCSGSGIMSCEVLQKGVKSIIAIENDKKTAQICKLNLMDVSQNSEIPIQIQVLCQNVITFLKKGPSNKKIIFNQNIPKKDPELDFVFLDPPYESNIYAIAQEYLLTQKWVKRSSTLICECSSKSLPEIHNGWKLQKTKVYGTTSLIFLTPNQALNYFDDTGSMR